MVLPIASASLRYPFPRPDLEPQYTQMFRMGPFMSPDRSPLWTRRKTSRDSGIPARLPQAAARGGLPGHADQSQTRSGRLQRPGYRSSNRSTAGISPRFPALTGSDSRRLRF